jgi:hypothetical protein
MRLAGGPENTNPMLAVLDRAHAAYSPIPNSDAITDYKSPRHLLLITVGKII